MGLFFRKGREIRANLEADTTNDSSNDIFMDDGLLSAMLSDVSITKEQALQIPTVNACINAIAGTIAGIPIKLYKQKDGATEQQKSDSRLFLLNKDTRDTLSITQFWRAMLQDYFLDTGGYAYIQKEYSMPVGLYYVDNKNVTPFSNYDHIFKQYMLMVDGQKYHDFEFFKLLRNTKNGWSAKPLTEESRLVLATAYKEFAFEHSLASKGGNKKGFLTSEHNLSDGQVSKLKRAFRRLFGTGEENAVVLPKGVDFKESSNTSVEMQLNENKETNAKEVCALFHVPIGIVRGNASKDDYTNFIKLAVMPILKDIEVELNRVMLFESEKSDMYFSFDTRNLTRGSLQERYAAYKEGLEANFLQIDEVRDWEDLPSMGIDFIKFGLDAVLYDPKTKTAYTPNTDQLTDVKKGDDKDGSGSEG